MGRSFLLFGLFVAAILPSCAVESSKLILDQTDGRDYELFDYYVDELGNEGIVGYIYKDNYMIVMSSDESVQPWGPTGEMVFPADSVTQSAITSQSFSLIMLQTMIGNGLEKYPAMNWCNSKNDIQSYPNCGSWRLPSHRDLRLVFMGYTNDSSGSQARITKINSALKRIGGTALNADGNYWTCSEDYDDYITVVGKELDYDPYNRAVNMTPMNSTSGNKDFWIKKNRYRVRAIKYIYYAK